MSMSLRNRLVLPVILSSLVILAACGGGSSSPPVNPPPSGGFANGNLNGTYVFSVTGSVADSASDFVTIMGVFTADGNGNITGGYLDQNSTASGGLILETITSGTYNIGADGRPTGTSAIPTGLLTLQTQNSGTFTFDYVLTSSQHGLMTEFESFGSASGTLDLQSNVTQADIVGQSYVFNFSGSSGFGSSICNFSDGNTFVIPYATVGAFTLDSSGNISVGLEDFNNNCISSGATNVAVTGGSIQFVAPVWTASIETTIGGSATTYNFEVFPIDKTHLKFIETDSLPILAGDAFTQTSSIPSGNNVYTVAGFDPSVPSPFTAAGLLVTDGSGNVTSASTEDINDGGVANEVTGMTGTYTALSGGRAELTFLTGFINGNSGIACASNCTFAVYPSSGGLQMLEIDDGGMTNGIAYAQTATSLASSQGYGMNLTGANVNSSSAEDDIAEFTNNNGNLAGIIDINQQGSTSFKNTFGANYSADSSIPGRGTVTPSTNGFFLTTYVVDNFTAVAVSSDNGFVGLGALVQQNSTAKSSVMANRLAVLRMAPSARMKRNSKGTIPSRPK
jgi:hypothetical protein